jgi:hypothetical protein
VTLQAREITIAPKRADRSNWTLFCARLVDRWRARCAWFVEKHSAPLMWILWNEAALIACTENVRPALSI